MSELKWMSEMNQNFPLSYINISLKVSTGQALSKSCHVGGATKLWAEKSSRPPEDIWIQKCTFFYPHPHQVPFHPPAFSHIFN